uniref:Uncharacterized protein n=1 Tax=Siphoviridae sp. ctQU013 TaxID=2826329 RepID=A0A8S5NMY7_9CAUD|nr:MAG TPA: hypothetical protein [Siphoviridae sp. ctQU013]
MFANYSSIHIEKIRHLFLSEPDRIFVKKHFNFRPIPIFTIKEHCRVLFVVHNRLHYVDLRILPQKKALLTKYTIEFLGAGEQLNNPNFDKFGASFFNPIV